MKVDFRELLSHNGYALGPSRNIRSKVLAEYLAEIPRNVLAEMVRTSSGATEFSIKLAAAGVPAGKLGKSGNMHHTGLILDSLGIDYSHFRKVNRPNRYKTRQAGDDMTPEEIISSYFVDDPVRKLSWNTLVKLIREHDLLPQVCSECGISSKWNGIPLRLHVDHINGVNNDNRIENLRHLCPNCHSQTSTYGGKNRKNRTKAIAESLKKV